MKPRQRRAPRRKHTRLISGSQGILTDAPPRARDTGQAFSPTPRPRHEGDCLLRSELPGLRGRSGTQTLPEPTLPWSSPPSCLSQRGWQHRQPPTSPWPETAEVCFMLPGHGCLYFTLFIFIFARIP